MGMKKILIAEDDEISTLYLKSILKSYNVLAHMADNGQIALEMFTKEFQNKMPYDLIFMDVMMPVLDGIEALLKIRDFEVENKVPPENKVRVVMTTATVDKKIILKATMLGKITNYLAKPIDPQKLRDILDELVAD